MICAINSSSESVYVDHISPLASLLDVPLLISDPLNETLTQTYYPEVKIRSMPDLEFRWNEMIEEFDTFIGCGIWNCNLNLFFPYLYQKTPRLIFCPHGQSDKGYKAPSLEHYKDQERVLFYGDLMQEMMKDLNIEISKSTQIGNYRYHYFQKHRDRLCQIVREEIFSKLNPSNRTLLYAPTWKDLDHSTTFFDYCEKVIQETPSHWNLIIKAHPLLSTREPARFYYLSTLAEEKENILMLTHFPLIYPLIDSVDVYLGDYSSIGYDVLAFQKPMFFLQNPNAAPAKLHQCGPLLSKNLHIFQTIEKSLPFSKQYIPIQQALYQKAFAPISDLKKAIQCLI